MRGWSQRARLEAATAAFLVFFVCGCTPMQTASPAGRSSSQVGEVQSPQMGGPVQPIEVPYIPAPTRMTLCGEPVPLNREAVYERFDREFTIIVYNHAQVYLWLKRIPRYFPVIEQRLKYYGLPDDLKYVAIAESDLLPNACSPVGAAGPWQFMPSTGAAYGLSQSRCVDDRYSFQRSTDSAFQLLKSLHDQFHDWPLALAAYNAGAQRVLNAMQVEGVNDYYDLTLPLQTERYVFRILAIKAVLSDPARYGYNLPAQYAYKPFRDEQVSLSLARPVPILTIANAAGTTFSEIKRLNPALRADSIPAGVYRINLPPGTREAFERNFRPGSPGTMLARNQGPAVSVRHAERRLNVSTRSRSVAIYRAEKRRPWVAKRRAEPVRAVSYRTGRGIRLAQERGRAAVKGVRLVRERRRMAVQRRRLAKQRRRIHVREFRLAMERRRTAVRKDRTAGAVSHRVRGRRRAPKAEVRRGRQRPGPTRAFRLREKRKIRRARPISHKVRGKARHRKSKLHGAKRKKTESQARR